MEKSYPLAPSIEDQEILDNFTNFTATTAKCKECKKTLEHTFLEDFTKHLQISHDYDRIIELENRIIQKGPLWKYIKLRKDSESCERYECVLCENKIANLDEEFLHHTHAHDEDDYTLRGKSYEEWQLKYSKERINNSEIKCDICEMNVTIKFDMHFLRHHIAISGRAIFKNCDKLRFNKNGQRRRVKALWAICRKLSINSVQCKRCKTEDFLSFNMEEFIDHLKTDHEIDEPISRRLDINLQKLHPKDSLYRCTICRQKFSETLHHECSEENKTLSVYEDFEWKYSVRLSDFLLKCALCPKVYFILDIGMDTCEASGCRDEIFEDDNCEEICDDSEHECEGPCVKKSPINTVWQCFDHESNTRATCRLCKQHIKSVKYVYIERTAFLAHVEDKHFDTFQLERKKQSVASWKYIKYIAGISVCVLCNEIVHLDEFDIHMHDDINDFPSYMLQDYEDWQWKYGTIFCESDDLSVRCDICRDRIQIASDLSEMKKHLKEIHSVIVQQDIGIEDIPDSSSLAGTQQQEEGIKNTAGSSFLVSQQQDMSGTPAKRRKID